MIVLPVTSHANPISTDLKSISASEYSLCIRWESDYSNALSIVLSITIEPSPPVTAAVMGRNKYFSYIYS